MNVRVEVALDQGWSPGRMLGVARESWALAAPSATLFAGTALARLLGLLFSVACARLLLPGDFARLAYGLTVVTFAAILIQNAPGGLARYLSRHRASRAEQEAYFSNWLLLVAVLLVVSLLLAVPLGLAAQLSGLMLLGLLANLVGVAIFATCFAAQRGLERFRDLTLFYVLANSIQLVVVVAAGLAGFRSAALFFVVYGLSNLPALLVMQRLAPLGLGFRRQLLDFGLVRSITHFAWPQLIQYGFYTVWLGADLVLVLHLAPHRQAGGYAVAKTLVVALGLAPGAVSAVLTPRMARQDAGGVARLLAAALLLIAGIVLPSLLLVLVFQRELVVGVFGARYLDALRALPWLAAGMGVYCFALALENTMIGLGRTRVTAVAAGAAAAVSVITALLLIPRLGLAGGGLAFAAGAAAQLLLLGCYTTAVLSGLREQPAERMAA